MSNPATIDRRDVAHPTNPIGGKAHVEEIRAANTEPAADETSPGHLDQIRVDGQKPYRGRTSRSTH